MLDIILLLVISNNKYLMYNMIIMIKNSDKTIYLRKLIVGPHDMYILHIEERTIEILRIS